MKQQQPTKKDLQRDLESIKEDLQLQKSRLIRITTAAETLGHAIQLLAKPSARPKVNQSRVRT
jgi:hypothetical protein